MDRVQTASLQQETREIGAAVHTTSTESVRKQVMARILSDSTNDKEDYILNYTAGRGGE